ncbi:MAG: 5-formyltetrahydrofolate cyclo-ligase [Clostridia bacterium]|nr:5-formyltetrahydrofolate cyclo-ligase [Clostridia bacterium]
MNGKDEVRKKLKIKRRYFSGVRREFADGCILDNFLLAYEGYDSFLVYNSFADEADTKLLITTLLSLGKRVYLPRVEGENIVAVPYGKTRKGAFGIDEPEGQAYFGKIDVTVIPLLAVNERGFRVGYGKGFYDRYLKDKPTQRVGLGYFFQIENFNEDEPDERLNSFVCEKGIYYYGTDT